MLAPGSSVIENDEYTSIIKEPGKREFTIRNSDLAKKIDTKPEKQTDLKDYVDRGTKAPAGKIIKKLMIKHAGDAKKRIEEDKKVKHRRLAGDTSCVTSVHSNVSRALRVRMPKKPMKLIVPAPQTHLVQSTSVIAPQTSGTQSRPTTAEQVIRGPPQRPNRKSTAITIQ